MLRDLLKEGGLYTVANLLTKGIGLLLLPLYTRYFSPDDYGTLDILIIFGTIFNGLVSLQLNQGLGRFLANESNPVLQKKLVSTIIFSATILYCLGFAVTYVFADFIISLLSSDVEIPRDIYVLSNISIAINGIFYIQSIYFRFKRKKYTYSILYIVHALLNISLTIFFVVQLGTGIKGVFYSSIITCPALIIVQLILMRSDLSLNFNKKILVLVIKYSAPLVPAVLLYSSLNFIDRIFIKEFIDFENLGVYAVALKFALGLEVLVVSFGMALNPIIYQRIEDKNTPDQLARIFHYYLMISMILLAVLTMFSKEIITTFTHSNYHLAYQVLPILFFAPILQGLNKFSIGINISKQTFWVPLVAFFSVITNIVLNYIFIPNYGMIGAALATCLSLAINNLILTSIGLRLFPIPLKKSKLIFALLIFFLIMGIYFITNTNWEISIGYLYLLRFVLIIIMIVSLNLLQIENINPKIFLASFGKKIR